MLFRKSRVKAIVAQMNTPMPLPLGRREFEEWSDRIISGALIQANSPEEEATLREGQKYALANMILHAKPTESHIADAYFIHSLRKVAANQVAHTIAQEILVAGKARTAAAEAAKVVEVPVQMKKNEPAPVSDQ